MKTCSDFVTPPLVPVKSGIADVLSRCNRRARFGEGAVPGTFQLLHIRYCRG
jgi:hypothetical protein